MRNEREEGLAGWVKWSIVGIAALFVFAGLQMMADEMAPQASPELQEVQEALRKIEESKEAAENR